MITNDDLRVLACAIEEGKRIVLITPNGIRCFKTQKECRAHPLSKGAQVMLRASQLLGGYYGG